MKTKTNSPATYALAHASQLANNLVNLLQPGCQRITVAGSIRRGCATVHDIDLVASARYEVQSVQGLFGVAQTLNLGPVDLLRVVRAVADIKEPKPDVKILRFEFFNGIPVELYLTEPDGSNFNALLQMRTGSRGHNAWLAGRAQRLGLIYHAGYGIFKQNPSGSLGQRVDDGSEEGIYTALGLAYVPPEQRG